MSTAYARDVTYTETRASYHHGALREELIAACVALIEAEGIGAVSLRRVARELSLPFVVTNDSHYTTPQDATPHEVLLAVQTGTTLADPARFRFEGTGYYLKSPQEMRAISAEEQWQAGCDVTLEIA